MGRTDHTGAMHAHHHVHLHSTGLERHWVPRPVYPHAVLCPPGRAACCPVRQAGGAAAGICLPDAAACQLVHVPQPPLPRWVCHRVEGVVTGLVGARCVLVLHPHKVLVTMRTSQACTRCCTLPQTWPPSTSAAASRSPACTYPPTSTCRRSTRTPAPCSQHWHSTRLPPWSLCGLASAPACSR